MTPILIFFNPGKSSTQANRIKLLTVKPTREHIEYITNKWIIFTYDKSSYYVPIDLHILPFTLENHPAR